LRPRFNPSEPKNGGHYQRLGRPEPGAQAFVVISTRSTGDRRKPGSLIAAKAWASRKAEAFWMRSNPEFRRDEAGCSAPSSSTASGTARILAIRTSRPSGRLEGWQQAPRLLPSFETPAFGAFLRMTVVFVE
jgi:hypothetical protein